MEKKIYYMEEQICLCCKDDADPRGLGGNCKTSNHFFCALCYFTPINETVNREYCIICYPEKFDGLNKLKAPSYYFELIKY